MYRRIIALLLGLAAAAAVALIGPAGEAQAAQTGLQRVTVQSDSWSGAYIKFACGNSYTVPVGATWGEGQANPKCGSYTYQAEPSHVYVGPGWCVTRWLNASGQREYFAGGGSGGWFQLWTGNQPADYVNHLQTWYGSWCPTSGGAYRSGYAF